MRKFIAFVIASSLIVFFGLLLYKNYPPNKKIITRKNNSHQSVKTEETSKSQRDEIPRYPLENSKERITKKKFGDYITPENSPVQPERFTGFHTGVDFEVFEDELETEVSVKAVCTGKIVYKNQVSGYGGVLIQECILENQTVTILYGHLNLASINKKSQENLEEGELIGFLGKGYSTETDGERKHLHLAIHKGEEINLLGYVQNQADLENWINPCLFFCN